MKAGYKLVCLAVLCSIGSIISAQSVAQPATASAQWPSWPIWFIAPFRPGGDTDLNARMIAPRLAAALGQQVVVENRPGAGGMLGTEPVARSAQRMAYHLLQRDQPGAAGEIDQGTDRAGETAPARTEFRLDGQRCR